MLHQYYNPLHNCCSSLCMCVVVSTRPHEPSGWRLGYLAAPTVFAKAAAAIQSQSTSGASSIAQQAALAALALGPYGGAPVAEMVEAFAQRRVRESSTVCVVDGQ